MTLPQASRGATTPRWNSNQMPTPIHNLHHTQPHGTGTCLRIPSWPSSDPSVPDIQLSWSSLQARQLDIRPRSSLQAKELTTGQGVIARCHHVLSYAILRFLMLSYAIFSYLTLIVWYLKLSHTTLCDLMFAYAICANICCHMLAYAILYHLILSYRNLS